MQDTKKSLIIEIDYPAPELTSEQVADLMKRMENALVHFFPELIKENDFTFIAAPRIKKS